MISVAGSVSIKTPDELLKRSGIDLTVWEAVPNSGQIKKWDVPMKLDGEPVIVPCFYVAVRVQRTWSASDLPSPVVLRVTKPRVSRPSAKKKHSVVHYSDVHFPHHDPATLSILYQITDFVDPAVVVDHGDLLDCEQISKYPKDPDHRTSMREENEMASGHLGKIHSLSPDAHHIFLEGNHENRLKRMIWGLAEDRRVGEILKLDPIRKALSWPSLLGIGDLGWEFVEYPDHAVLHDRLILCHGDIVRSESGQTEKAMLSRYGRSGISGHTHRRGFYQKRDHVGSRSWYGLGCMCEIRDASYVTLPNWSQGFAVSTWSDDRSEFGVEAVEITEGKAFFRGQLFTGDSTS
tara:strand:- start:5589 stop:6635 length:1047 start_codon:yes stop_codon:yes gene_type:complete